MDWTLASQSSVGGKRSISSDPGGIGQDNSSHPGQTLLIHCCISHLPF